LRYDFDPAAPAGQRLSHFRLANGTTVKDETRLTVAMIDYFFAKSETLRPRAVGQVDELQGKCIQN